MVKHSNMDDEKDEILLLSDTHPQLSYEHKESSLDKFSSGTGSATDSGTSFKGNRNVGHPFVKSKPEEPYDPNPDILRQQKKLRLTDEYSTYDGVTKNGGMHNGTFPDKNERLLESGQLGMCNDPYCTTSSSYYNYKAAQGKPKFHNALYGDAKGWARSLLSFLQPYIPAGVMNPHPGFVQHWNKFFVISCLVSIFVDPLFFFVISVLEQAPDPTKESERYVCIRLDRPTATALVILRTITDVIYLFHILLQLWQAYASPVFGDDPKKIACRYLTGFFLIDLFAVLPIPQVITLTLLSKALDRAGTSGFAQNLIRVAILVQYLPRLYRFWPLLAGLSPSGFIFESAWVNFVVNLLTFILCGHVIGSCWYHFGSMRVYHCLQDACHDSKMDSCMEFIYCGYGNNAQKYSSRRGWSDWIKYPNATACLDDNNNFQYGIYEKAVKLVARPSFTTRYVYSLFWGFQQISTVAGNLTPSYFVWEVLFTMAIIGLALLLFALIIGNMQNFLQSLGRRRLEMTLRRRDVKQWMRHRRLPKKLRRKVLEAERNSWAATMGVNEEMLMENLPEDLQIEIKRHYILHFVRRVRILQFIDEPILNSIYERLRLKTYIKGSKILYRGGFFDKMVFIIRGKLGSIGEDGIIVPLSEGDVCGDELLLWCLENSSDYRDGKRTRSMGQRCPCNMTVKCLTDVEVFILRAVDIQEVTSMYSRNLQNLRLQGALRYESPYWRCSAATRIQVAWRYRKNKKRTKSRGDQL